MLDHEIHFVLASDSARLAAVRELFGEVHRLMAEAAGEEALPGGRLMLAEDFLADYQSPSGGLALACLDGLPAGIGAFRVRADVDYPNACELHRLYVRPAVRRFGLGRALALALLDHARAAGYSTMLLDTFDDTEAARGLYESLGFESIAPYYFDTRPGAHYFKVDLDDIVSKY